jgi:hypothetical protein
MVLANVDGIGTREITRLVVDFLAEWMIAMLMCLQVDGEEQPFLGEGAGTGDGL